MSSRNCVIILFVNEDVIEFKNLGYFSILKVDGNNVYKNNKILYKYEVLVCKLSSLLLSEFVRHSYKKRKVDYPRHFRRVQRCMTTEYSLEVAFSIFFCFT